MARFLFVHHGENSPRDNGYEPGRLGYLSRALVDRGHQVTRVLPGYPHLQRELRSPKQFQDAVEGAVVHLDTKAYGRPRGLERYQFLKSFRAELKRLEHYTEEPDLILAAFFPGVSSVLCQMKIDNGWRSKIVVDIRDIWPDAQLATANGLARLPIQVWALTARSQAKQDLDAADATVSVSSEYLIWARAVSNSVAVRPAAFFPIASSTMQREIDHSVDLAGRAVFVGSVNSHFDFESMIRSWELMLRSWQELPLPILTIVGDGPALRWLRRRCSNLPSVRFTGQLSKRDAIRTMRGASVGIAPYHSRAMMTSTNKIAEYLASGLFVISTLETALCSELAKLNCLDLVRCNDTDEFATRLGLRLRQTRGEFAPAAEQAHKAHFDARVVSSSFADFLESLSNEKLPR